MTRAATLVRELYAIQKRLREAFPGRRFSLDGKLVGDLGEVIAAERYGLELVENPSNKGHDAIRVGADGSHNRVEVKTTQLETKRPIIAFSPTVLDDPPDELIVLVIHPDGSVEEAYNGPASPILAELRGSGDHQRTISLARIRRVAPTLAVEAMIGTEDA
jgi:hypothetical protein